MPQFNNKKARLVHNIPFEFGFSGVEWNGSPKWHGIGNDSHINTFTKICCELYLHDLWTTTKKKPTKKKTTKKRSNYTTTQKHIMGIVHSLVHEKIAVITNELIAQSAQWFTRGTVQQRKLLRMIHQQMKDDPELYKLFALWKKEYKGNEYDPDVASELYEMVKLGEAEKKIPSKQKQSTLTFSPS